MHVLNNWTQNWLSYPFDTCSRNSFLWYETCCKNLFSFQYVNVLVNEADQNKKTGMQFLRTTRYFSDKKGLVYKLRLLSFFNFLAFTSFLERRLNWECAGNSSCVKDRSPISGRLFWSTIFRARAPSWKSMACGDDWKSGRATREVWKRKKERENP